MSSSQVKTKFEPSSTVYIPLLEGGLKMILEGAASEEGRSHVNFDMSSWTIRIIITLGADK